MAHSRPTLKDFILDLQTNAPAVKLVIHCTLPPPAHTQSNGVFSKPSTNNLLHWKEAFLNNNQSRTRLQNMMNFLMENETLINGPSTD
ncbi:hypothetical protein AVEN_207559-1 [Araneus ventricosus]|uniref:Uncharacterized protein n=1 Tax=Araneus ventricosus TaxID=182803 RepID=A0A4Y2PB37_ARAVE|nr:hypothetical protein AVEN_207559-1 [Araneus ventricosus]